MRQVYAADLYGPRGAGVTEHGAHLVAGQSPSPIPNPVMDRVDVITGILIVVIPDDHIDCCFRYPQKGIRCCWGLHCKF